MHAAFLLSIFAFLVPLLSGSVLANELPLEEQRSESSRPLAALEPVDDGWRRTALGWEHNSTWQSPARTVSSNTLPPALLRPLAYCLIAAGIIGLYLLLLREIDPIEQRAFRIRTNR